MVAGPQVLIGPSLMKGENSREVFRLRVGDRQRLYCRVGQAVERTGSIAATPNTPVLHANGLGLSSRAGDVTHWNRRSLSLGALCEIADNQLADRRMGSTVTLTPMADTRLGYVELLTEID